MKRTLETATSQKIAESADQFPDMRVRAIVDNASSQHASNDAGIVTPIRAIDAMAICMASSTFGG
jgi:hypothetical protein